LLFISLSTQSGNFWIHPRMLKCHGYRYLYMADCKKVQKQIPGVHSRQN